MAPLFATKTEFIIQQADAQVGGLGSMFRGTQFATSQDTIAVQGYLQSRDAMLRLDRDLGFKAHYAQGFIDPVQRLDPGASNEAAYRLYQRNVKIGYDPTEGLIKMEVIAADPAVSQSFAEALIGYAEEQVDQLSARLREDQMKGARDSFADAEAKVEAAQQKVLALQERLGVLDPMSESNAVMSQVIEKVGKEIKTFEDYVRGFIRLGDEALAEKRIKNAAFYYRAAEFLVDPEDKQKFALYNKFVELFYQGFAEDGIEQHKVAYAGGFLPVMRLAPKGRATKGTLLAFGGFDSFIEDFYCMWAFFAEAGYEFLAFEGPGQGGALRTYGIPFDHDWEKPTAAVLDHFKVKDAALLGDSMGGYWGLPDSPARAASIAALRVNKLV